MITSESVPAHLAETELAYARLLYGSGIPVTAISKVVRAPELLVRLYARAHGWTRHTPWRRDAVIGVHRPALVRCPECGAKYGQALNRPARPCPRCGRTGLVLL